MKYFIPFLIVAITIINTLSAQITITQNDMPNNGDTIRSSITIDLFAIDPEPTGENFLWDFSDLTPMNQKVDSFLSMSDVNIVYQLFFYGVANQAQPTTNGLLPANEANDAFTFYDNDASYYGISGVGATYNQIPIPLKFNGVDKLVHLPLAYNDLDSSYSDYEIEIPETAYATGWKKRVNIADGWGILITPYGSFDVLRQKSTITQYDSVYIDSLGIGFPINREYKEYRWLGEEKGTPLLFYSDDFLGPQISYIDSVRVLTTINENPIKGDCKLFPNPAKTYFIIQNNFPLKTIEIVDINGKMLFFKNINLKKSFKVDLNEINIGSGIYFIRIQSENEFINKKLVIY